MTGAISVMVVDDKASCRSAARAVIESTDGFKFVGEADDGLQAISLADLLRPDLVLMDINMPNMGGPEVTRRITAGHPDITVWLCSTYEVADLPEDARNCGARAYVHKNKLSSLHLSRLWQDSGRPALHD
jgi:DNA-binding NarL/FixJ family response regulator